VIADIPGLIEGASEGAGLGHEFLAHVERTSVLVHVLDIAPELSGAGQDRAAAFATIEEELARHDPRLAELPRVLALSKADLLEPARGQAIAAAWRERLGEHVAVVLTSSATELGVRELAAELLRRVPSEPARGIASEGAARDREEALPEHAVFRPLPAAGFSVQRLGPGSFAVRGPGIERLLARHDLDNEEALAYVEGRLRRIGVISALEDEGFQPGDEVEIAGVTFELDPE
jgi:GTP-binding protein